MFKSIKVYLRKRRLRKSLSILKNFDTLMHVAGISRQERRHVWREVSKGGEEREKVINRIAKETGVE